jgi:hypothetical protein
MKKIRLDVDDLTVESFGTNDSDAARRTVFGYDSRQSGCWTLCQSGCPGDCGETAYGDTVCDVGCTAADTQCAPQSCATLGYCGPCY